MGLQCLDGVVVAGEFGFGQGGVDFLVADLMEQHRGPVFTAPEPRDQVVQALWRVGWDRARAKGANRV